MGLLPPVVAEFKANINDFTSKMDEIGLKIDKAAKKGETSWKTYAAAGGIAAVAIGAFGVKAVNAFDATAKAAIDMSKATGMSTEEASRWISISSQWGVSAEDLTKGIGRIAKTLDKSVWEGYGIATRDAAGNAKDANTLFLDALDTLNNTQNSTERARIGYELFGKGFATIAPVLGHTRDEYTKMLGAVRDGEVVTGDSVKRAEEMRKAQDNLGKAVHQLTLEFGSMLADGAPLINFIAGLADKVDRLLKLTFQGDAKKLSSGLKAYTDTAKAAGTDTVALVVAFDKLAAQAGDSRSAIDKLGKAFSFSGLTSGAPERFEDIRKAMHGLADAAPDVAQQTVTALTAMYEAAKNGSDKAKDWVTQNGITMDGLLELGTIASSQTTPALDGTADSAKKLADATFDAAQNTRDLTKAQDDFAKKTSNAWRDARDRVKLQQEINAGLKDWKDGHNKTADAAVALSEKITTLNKGTLDSRDAVNYQIVVLQLLEGKLGKGSKLYKQIQDQITQLQDMRDAMSKALSPDLNPQALSGYTSSGYDPAKGGMAAGHGGQPRMKSNSLLSGANPGWTGGVQNQSVIYVQVPPTADKAAIGREIVSAIRAYERANSNAWRTQVVAS